MLGLHHIMSLQWKDDKYIFHLVPWSPHKSKYYGHSGEAKMQQEFQ